MFEINGKVAVITGAGGVLGGSIAKGFVDEGAKVIAMDIRQENLDRCVAELTKDGGVAIGKIGNVLDIQSLEKVAEEIVAELGTIDILINVAGGNVPGATLKQTRLPLPGVCPLNSARYSRLTSFLLYTEQRALLLLHRYQGSLISGLFFLLQGQVLPRWSFPCS